MSYHPVSRPAAPAQGFPQQHNPMLQSVQDSANSSWPKVGQTRCYWVLLSAELNFIFLDPVLSSHMGQQSERIIGKSLLDFVHPDERASARHDLADVVESRTLHGSVTRVRYCRLSRIRKFFGWDGVLDIAEEVDIDKVVYDDEYLAADLVVNLAAEGLVLCFIHAVVDITPQDNDESRKTPWTNWCGSPTGGITPEHYSVLYQRLRPIQTLNTVPPRLIFQILLNDSQRRVLFSWPGEGYSPDDFKRLAADVQMPFQQEQEHGHAASTGGAISRESDAKTSCTRRYKAQQLIQCQDGAHREVESLFIPYGCIIFACHKTVSARASAPSTHLVSSGQSMTNALHPPPPGLQSGFYAGSNTYYDTQSPYDGFSQRPVSAQTSPTTSQSYSSYSQHNQLSGQGSLAMPPHNLPQQMAATDPWSAGAAPLGVVPGGPYPSQQHWGPHVPTTYPLDSATARTHYQGAPSPQLPSISPTDPDPPSSSSSSGMMNEVPPARPRANRSPGAPGSRETFGRAGGNPPNGVTKCGNCKTKNSPEWRKGPSGKKDLCNACGLRFARSRAKKEGVSVQRRRKDKDTPPAQSKPKKGSPARSTSSSFAMVPGADDNSANASPGTGHPNLPMDGYPQSHSLMMAPAPGGFVGLPTAPHQMGVGEITPSPSPPTPTHMAAHPTSTAPGGTNGMGYYSSGQMHYGAPSAGYNTIGRLPPASASFERGVDERPRDRERERLPPTPISADPRRGHHADRADAMYVHGQA